MQKTKRHAIINRIHVRLGLALALVGGFSLSANAGYAQLAPPSGFGGSAGNWTFAPSANQAAYGNVLHHPGALRVPVPGTTATMPAAYRLAANAPRIAAAAIFVNPYVRTGVAIASWLGVASFFWDEAAKLWKKTTEFEETLPNGIYYSGTYWANGMYKTADEACSVAAANRGASVGQLYSGFSGSMTGETTCNISATRNSDGAFIENWGGDSINKGVLNCPAGTVPTVGGCKSSGSMIEPLTEAEFIDRLPANPMPVTVPLELPPNTPLPVEQPVINPEPGPNPTPRPLFVPTGNPVPNPNYDPNAAPSPENQPWLQPAVRVVPSPTPTEPWRVDLQPVNRPVPGPEPMPEPLPEVDPNAPASDKPSQEQTDFCAKNPDVLACAKPELDTPEDEIPKSDKNITLMEENLFGPGACPADVYFAPHGLQQFKVWDWNQSCGYITEYLKPILIICCTFAAFMILIPGRTE